ncbi:MAG: ADP-ribosylglycohydrolase family protein, partial [Anaerolineae bacterium]|nr:ADP-ribosylglycohydrolase family protein [Anaerolineae bacterium]
MEGLSVGDALGGFFEFGQPHHLSRSLQERKLPNTQWRFTDDTNMALSIYQNLRLYGEIKQDELAASFAHYFDRSRGYGLGARHLMIALRDGRPWRSASREMFNNKGSFGNGGAMRVAPLGAYFADDLEAVVTNARLSAEITHAHPEGIAGAIAVAVA